MAGVFDGLNPPAGASGEELARWVKRLRDRLIAWVGTVMHENQAAAVTWFLTMLSMLDELDEESGFDGTPVFEVQLVYLHFLYEGSVPLSTPRVSDLPMFWKRDIITVSILWRILSQALQEVELGRELRLEGGRLVVLAEDEAAFWAEEVNANQRKWEPSWERVQEALSDPYVQEAERLVVGSSIYDMLMLIIASAEFGKHSKRNAGRNYFFVELGQTAPPDVREVFRRVALTRRRLSQQLAPDFLYRPNAPILRDTATALDASGAFDWLTFAPVMLGSHKERTEPCPVAIVSTYLVERAMLKTYTGVARRLAVAEQASKQIGPEASRSIAELRRQFHQGLEIRAAETLRGVGMTAVRGLERLDGRQIECGEIDVLAAGAGAGRELIVLICEVKDTDLSFFKDYGPREAFEVARRAHRQAQRKATWVAQHWPRVAGVFQLDAEHPEVQFVAVVVPRITPLPLGGGVASIPLLELGEVGTRVLTEPSSAWRPDLQRARVVASAIAS